MSMKLVPGANASLEGSGCTFTLTSESDGALGEYAGVALLPANDKRQPCGEPALLHSAQSWMEWQLSAGQVSCTLKLTQLPAGSDRALLIVYTFGAAGPLRELAGLKLVVNGATEHALPMADYGDAAMIVAEFYRRNDQWKVRALADASAYGLAALGRRLGIEIDERHPNRPSDSAGASGQNESASATGSGFAVSAKHILTCAHVIEGVDNIFIASFEGRYRGEPVVVDRRNDLALLRISAAPALKPVTFREGLGTELGEGIVALGFPLAGLAGGGVQVTQGGVSGLFGLRDDASLLQFTAPIQPGSSGSPLFDQSGLVVGLVTSSMSDAQNMNFAVKSALVLSFLEAARVDALRARNVPSRSTPELVREAQASLWRIEASRF
ncbi:MAG: S1-C subfamily serine protease [Pseudomonas sp.]|jgi:S1-C subfamily serine protease